MSVNTDAISSSSTSIEKSVSTKRRFWGSRSEDVYEKLEQIGEGTYGQVWRGRNKESGEIVAMKKVRMDQEREGFPITAIREIKILKELNHENIVKLKEIVTSVPKAEHSSDTDSQSSELSTDKKEDKGSIYMVFEYMEHDLTGLMESQNVRFTDSQIKCYMKQLLEGLFYCHTNGVLHRDIKGSNLLINNQGILKLADFGLARPYNEQNKNLTNRVITLWYRPPELLLGSTKYTTAVDMWSVGCILAELISKKAILQGKNEIDQFQRICKLCGTPDEASWPGVAELEAWTQLEAQADKKCKRRVREIFRDFPPDALDLVDKLLVLDPSKRLGAHQALDHDYFWNEPLPAQPSSLPKYEPSHEFQTKKKKQQRQAQAQQAQQAQQQGINGSQHPNKRPRMDPPQNQGPPTKRPYNAHGHHSDQTQPSGTHAHGGHPHSQNSHHGGQYGQHAGNAQQSHSSHFRGAPRGPGGYSRGGRGGGYSRGGSRGGGRGGYSQSYNQHDGGNQSNPNGGGYHSSRPSNRGYNGGHYNSQQHNQYYGQQHNNTDSGDGGGGGQHSENWNE